MHLSHLEDVGAVSSEVIDFGTCFNDSSLIRNVLVNMRTAFVALLVVVVATLLASYAVVDDRENKNISLPYYAYFNANFDIKHLLRVLGRSCIN